MDNSHTLERTQLEEHGLQARVQIGQALEGAALLASARLAGESFRLQVRTQDSQALGLPNLQVCLQGDAYR
jgi:hypothetical protein